MKEKDVSRTEVEIQLKRAGPEPASVLAVLSALTHPSTREFVILGSYSFNSRERWPKELTMTLKTMLKVD